MAQQSKDSLPARNCSCGRCDEGWVVKGSGDNAKWEHCPNSTAK